MTSTPDDPEGTESATSGTPGDPDGQDRLADPPWSTAQTPAVRPPRTDALDGPWSDQLGGEPATDEVPAPGPPPGWATPSVDVPPPPPPPGGRRIAERTDTPTRRPDPRGERTAPTPVVRPAGPPPSAPPTAPPPPAWATAPPAAPPLEVPARPAHAEPAPSYLPVPAPTQPAEVRRYTSATDFLDRRDADQGVGLATWGWRGRARRWSGGLVKPRRSAKEEAHEQDRARIQRDFDGPRTIVFINPKGGAAKTTGVLAAGYTFGTVRGGGVVAWDNNETRGTLGMRGTRGAHRNTTRELLEDLGRFKDVYQSRIGDLGAFVRSQGDAHFDVLASDERPDVTGTIRADDFREVHALLERFYRILLVDTGNNMRAEN